MKKFWKTVLAVIVATIILNIIGVMLFTGFISALGSSDSSATIPGKGVMVIDMSQMSVAERGQEDNPLLALQGEALETVGLWDAIRALRIAQTDPAVEYIYLKSDGAAGDFAALQEFRGALENFKASGKAVIAYTEAPGTGSYYLASVADKIYMSSYAGGNSMITGISSQLIFLKDLLDMLGVNIQLIRHGKYKSAGEMYINNHPSPENLEQNQVMINSIWSSYASQIAQSRGITVEALNKAIDNLELNYPQDFIDHNLVDALYTREELRSQLAVLANATSINTVKFFKFSDYVEAKVLPGKGKEKIAIIYADGEIVDGNTPQDVAGDYFARQIAKVREDKAVKAVVLRVNSPGGSVVASDKIKTELDLLKAEKPLVASYGGYAASGGYWISSNCEKIFSDPVTLTGSIGVFSMIPDLSKTINKLARVNITTVGSNKHGDMLSLMRPLDAEETAYMQASVETIYDRFVTIVSEGRGLDKTFVDDIAQGRVWAGTDALEIGLVDELGGLEDAINYAAGLAGNPDLSAWNITETPAVPTFMETLQSMLGTADNGEVARSLSGTPLEGVAKSMLTWQKSLQSTGRGDFFFARMPYQIILK